MIVAPASSVPFIDAFVTFPELTGLVILAVGVAGATVSLNEDEVAAEEACPAPSFKVKVKVTVPSFKLARLMPVIEMFPPAETVEVPDTV